MSRPIALVVALMLGAGCTFQGSPVPVLGDTRLLEGEWEGSYVSELNGRSGRIFFSLKAGTDSAYGDVLMLPPEFEEFRLPTQPDRVGPTRSLSQSLGISFVRCDQGDVTGRLDPYLDPVSGERVFTTFEGRLKGRVFKGTFSSSYQSSGRRVTGKWTVERKAS